MNDVPAVRCKQCGGLGTVSIAGTVCVITGTCPDCKGAGWLPAPAEPARPAFALRTATVWFVVLAYRTQEGPMANLQAHLLTADPTGVELHAVAKAFTERQVPGAREVTLVRVERHGEAYGTAASGGGAS